MKNQFDREEEQYERDLLNGLMTQTEYNNAIRALQREYREYSQEAAEQAYRNELERW